MQINQAILVAALCAALGGAAMAAEQGDLGADAAMAARRGQPLVLLFSYGAYLERSLIEAGEQLAQRGRAGITPP